MVDRDYFPGSEEAEGWRRLVDPAGIVRRTGMIPQKLDELARWSLSELSGEQNAGLVIRHGWVVCEWGNSGASPGTLIEIKSAAKALAILCTGIAIDRARAGEGGPATANSPPLDYDRYAYDYIDEGHPLSDQQKAAITVRQLMHHVGGVLPECTGVSNYPPEDAGFWEFVLGKRADFPTASLYAAPGTKFLYGTYDIRHLPLILRAATGSELDDLMAKWFCAPCGITQWSMDRQGGGGYLGPHADFRVRTTPRDLARIGYLMLHGGRWREREVIPAWLMEETFARRFPGIVPDHFTYHWMHKAPTWPTCVPEDLYYIAGAGINLCVVAPGMDLVAVRMGTAFGADWAQVMRDFMVHLFAAVDGNVPPPQDATRPETTVSQPREGQTISGQVEIVGMAEDADGIDRVEIDIDGCGDPRPAVGGTKWRYLWDTRESADGPHKMFVRAFDRSGNASSPPLPLVVNVANGNESRALRLIG